MSASLLHPKQQENRERREALEKLNKEKKEFVKKQIEKYHLRFCHIRAPQWASDDVPVTSSAKGGATVAFQLPSLYRGRIINISCALVNKKDVFCKREGRYWAAKHFNEGSVIQLRIARGMTPSKLLKSMFAWVV